MKITHIKVLCGVSSTDTVMLYTDLPEGVWPFKDGATFSMAVAKGHGEDYAKSYFPGIPVEVVTK
jgi:hypothetical protein